MPVGLQLVNLIMFVVCQTTLIILKENKIVHLTTNLIHQTNLSKFFLSYNKYNTYQLI